MKIAFNARLLKAVPDDGISRFTYEVITRIIKMYPTHSYALIFDKKPGKNFSFPENTGIYHLSPPSRHPLLWYTWHELQLPGLLKKTGADVFVSTDGIIPLRSEVPAVPVIHDINFYHRPGDIPLLTRQYYRIFFRRFAAKAERIITVSEFCKRDISEGLKVDPGKIDVAYNGVSEYFKPCGKSMTDTFRKDLTGGKPYFLFVGNFSPRKNIPGLIKAYDQFRNNNSTDHKLVLTGGRLYLNGETDSVLRSSPWRKDIILTGPMTHERLRLLYCSASALVFVPWFEGFGIPVAEAMKCGLPVIISNTTSLPEVGGDAALPVDPGNPVEIAAAMRRIISDEILRLKSSDAGIIQSEKFTWDKTAEAVMKSIEKIEGSR